MSDAKCPKCGAKGWVNSAAAIYHATFICGTNITRGGHVEESDKCKLDRSAALCRKAIEMNAGDAGALAREVLEIYEG